MEEVHGCGRCRYAPTGCSNCKAPGFVPTAANLVKRAELGGRVAPRTKPPVRKSKGARRKPKAERVVHHGTASRPAAVKRMPVDDSDGYSSGSEDWEDDNDDFVAAPASAAKPAGRSAPAARSPVSRAPARAPARAAAKPAKAAATETRYSYCSGKSPLAAAQGLAKMRATVEALGKTFGDEWLCTVTEVGNKQTDICFSHYAPHGSNQRITCRSVPEVLTLLDILDKAKQPAAAAAAGDNAAAAAPSDGEAANTHSAAADAHPQAAAGAAAQPVTDAGAAAGEQQVQEQSQAAAGDAQQHAADGAGAAEPPAAAASGAAPAKQRRSWRDKADAAAEGAPTEPEQAGREADGHFQQNGPPRKRTRQGAAEAAVAGADEQEAAAPAAPQPGVKKRGRANKAELDRRSAEEAQQAQQQQQQEGPAAEREADEADGEPSAKRHKASADNGGTTAAAGAIANGSAQAAEGDAHAAAGGEAAADAFDVPVDEHDEAAALDGEPANGRGGRGRGRAGRGRGRAATAAAAKRGGKRGGKQSAIDAATPAELPQEAVSKPQAGAGARESSSSPAAAAPPLRAASPPEADGVGAGAPSAAEAVPAADAAVGGAAAAADGAAARDAIAEAAAAAAAAEAEDSEAAGFSGVSELSGGDAVAAAVDGTSGGVDGGAFMSKLQERMQEVRAARRADGESPQKQPSTLASPRPSRGRRMSQAGGLAAAGDPRVATYEPPASPFGLIEEQLYPDPWKLLVACLLLNKTSARAVRQVIWSLFELCPTPEAAVAADTKDISAIIDTLGFYKRAAAMQRFSKDYLEKQWSNPEELFGIGKYGADAYFMFCRGDWQRVLPKDKDLLKYKLWLEETDGQGQGLSRDSIPTAGTQPASGGQAAAAGVAETQAAVTAAVAAEAAVAPEAASGMPPPVLPAVTAPQSQPAVRADVGPDE